MLQKQVSKWEKNITKDQMVLFSNGIRVWSHPVREATANKVQQLEGEVQTTYQKSITN